uniref:Uncharacterized protein n=1 Tax=Gorilla gorilla gorilla TaxID=9595 RepID=A0A2I2Y8S2_GORGO
MQRRIHGNLKRKDTEMMLQWLQQEKVKTCSSVCIQGRLRRSQGRRGDPCSSGGTLRRSHSDPRRTLLG